MLCPGLNPVCSSGRIPCSCIHFLKCVIKHFSYSLEKHGNNEMGRVSSMCTNLDFVLDNKIIFAVCQCEGVCMLDAKLLKQSSTKVR